MEKLAFSKCYIEIIVTLYKDNISMIINNGFLSDTVINDAKRTKTRLFTLATPICYPRGSNNQKHNDNTIIGLTIHNSRKQLKYHNMQTTPIFFYKTKSR